MSVGTPLDPIAPITTEEGTPSPKIVTTLQYPWEHVVQGTAVPYQKTLPNNEVHLTRIIQLDMGFPAWIKKLTGAEVFTVREDAIINPKERTMKLRSCNITLYNSVRMYEECQYTQHPDNQNWTLKEQIAYLDLVYCRTHVCLGLKKGVEGFARSLFVSRAHNAAKDEVKLLQSSPLSPSPSSS